MSDTRKLIAMSGQPGIFRRVDADGEMRCYVVRTKDARGRSIKRTARTLAEARALRSALVVDVRRGEFDDGARSREGFTTYARAWVKRYAGRSSKGLREITRAEYERDLELFGVPFFREMRLGDIRAQDLGEFAAWVASRPNRRHPGRPLAAGTVRLALVPVKLVLATAQQEGLIRSNPAHGLRLAQSVARRPASDQNGVPTKALTEGELQSLIACHPEEWRLFVRFLAETGLRISEAVGLRWADVDFDARRIFVVRRIRGSDQDAPKSEYGRRRIPLTRRTTDDLAKLRANTKFVSSNDPVFASRRGGPLSASNVFSRVFKPAAREAGVGWAGFHTLRHTCASALFRRGASHKQVQVWLGHSDPGFTLRTYVHLLPEDLPDPSILDDLTRPGGEGA